MIVLLLSLLLSVFPADSARLGAEAAPPAWTDGRVSLVMPRRDARVDLRRPSLGALAEAVLDGIRLEAVGAGQVTEMVIAIGIAHEGRLRTAVVSDPLRLTRDGVQRDGRTVRTLLDAFDDPTRAFDDPLLGFESVLRASDPATVGFVDPIFGFEDPLFGFEDPLFGFGSPEEALQGVWREGARSAGDGTVLVVAVMPGDHVTRVTGDAALVGLNVNEARPRSSR